jgi:5S rRNA maturation endonuclease (ribonuclease M5)
MRSLARFQDLPGQHLLRDLTLCLGAAHYVRRDCGGRSTLQKPLGQVGERSVIVVEGFFAAMKLHQAGFRSVVALMGCSMSEEQEELLLGAFSQVALLLDGDAAAKQAAAEIAGRLVCRTFVRVVDLAAGCQPDDMEVEELGAVLQRI